MNKKTKKKNQIRGTDWNENVNGRWEEKMLSKRINGDEKRKKKKNQTQQHPGEEETEKRNGQKEIIDLASLVCTHDKLSMYAVCAVCVVCAWLCYLEGAYNRLPSADFEAQTQCGLDVKWTKEINEWMNEWRNAWMKIDWMGMHEWKRKNKMKIKPKKKRIKCWMNELSWAAGKKCFLPN